MSKRIGRSNSGHSSHHQPHQRLLRGSRQNACPISTHPLELLRGNLSRHILDISPNIVYVYNVHEPACLYVNQRVEQVLGYTPTSIQTMTATSLSQLIHPADWDEMKQHIRCWKTWQKADVLEWECRVKQSNGQWKWLRSHETVLQFTAEGLPQHIVGMAHDITVQKQSEQELRSQLHQKQLTETITRHIRQSLDLNTILQTTVQEVQHLLKADRVLIYRFLPDKSASTVVVEACLPELPSLLGWTIGSSQLDQEWHIEPFCNGEVRAIANITTSTLDPAYKHLLQSFAVKAQLDIPIIRNLPEIERTAEMQQSAFCYCALPTYSLNKSIEHQLWGLLVVQQCQTERDWQPWEIQLLKQVENQLAVAIQQSQLYKQLQQFNASLELQVKDRTEQLQEALDFEAVLKRITDKVRDSLDEALILQTAVRELAIAFDATTCHASLYDLEQQTATIRYEYTTSNTSSQGIAVPMNQAAVLYESLIQQQSLQFCPLMSPLSERVAILTCPMFDDHGTLGDIRLIHQPKHQFSQPEIRLMQQVANQCAIALRQSRLYQAAKEQVRELEKLNTLKDDFLNTISHELRTPLSSIRMVVQVLEIIFQECFGYEWAEASLGMNSATALSPIASSIPNKHQQTGSHPVSPTPVEEHCDPPNPAKQTAIKAAHCLKILQEESDREINLINDLLTLQQLEAGNQPFIPSLIHLQNWIPQVTETFDERFHDHHHQLVLNLPSDLPPLTTDLYMFNRILGELLTNAYKFTPPGAIITVTAQASAHPTTPPIPCITLTLSNSGIEIPQTELALIFNRFYRIPSTDPWKYGGTGLGLALVKKLTTYLGGWVWAESDRNETRFMVQLPINLKDHKS